MLQQFRRGEQSLRDAMDSGQVISWHRLQAVRLRRVAAVMDVGTTETVRALREVLSLANEFDEMGDQYLLGKVVRP